MKKQKKKNRYQEKLSWDDMTYGDHLTTSVRKLLRRFINLKNNILVNPNTEKVGKTIWGISSSTRTLDLVIQEIIGSTPIFSTILVVHLVVRTPGFHPGNKSSILLRNYKTLWKTKNTII